MRTLCRACDIQDPTGHSLLTAGQLVLSGAGCVFASTDTGTVPNQKGGSARGN